MRFAAIVDALILACWCGLALDNVRMAVREGGARDAGRRPPSPLARLGAVALLVAGVAVLEGRAGGRLWLRPLVALAGVGLAVAGLLLHAWARRALGTRWTSAVAAPADHRLVTTGPYALVRHPIYLGVLSLAAGTVLAHPSVATLCVAAGLTAGMVRKIPAEERVLRAACGADWERYAATVPMLAPRPSALLRRAWR